MPSASSPWHLIYITVYMRRHRERRDGEGERQSLRERERDFLLVNIGIVETKNYTNTE